MSNPPRGHSALSERLDFVGLDREARTSLNKLQPLLRKTIGPALDAFYKKIKATPETRKFFGDEKHIAGAKGAQERHWEIIAAAQYNDDYVDAVLKVGRTHARIGLEPRWYIGGYALVIEQLIHAIVKDRWPSVMRMVTARPEGMAAALSSLVKAAMLDMDFAISVYLETLDEQRRRAEDAAREAIERERQFVVNSIGVGLAKLAAKDLHFRLAEDMPEAYRAIQENFNAAMANIEEALSSVNSGTATIRVGAQQIAAASVDLGRRTEQQAAGLEETAATLEEITRTVANTAEGAKRADQIVTSATTKAEKSRLVMAEAVFAMKDIEKSSGEISQIITLIDEVAFQTNLLALNAGVEAARAGESGRGFAVVASEVRALAQRSAQAAKDIKSLILASSGYVKRGAELVAESSGSLEAIIGQVSEINKVVSQISIGANEQATALREVNTALNQMDQVTQQNAAMVEESTAASRSLARETDVLSELIGEFQIGTHAILSEAGSRANMNRQGQRPPALKAVANSR